MYQMRYVCRCIKEPDLKRLVMMMMRMWMMMILSSNAK